MAKQPDTPFARTSRYYGVATATFESEGEAPIRYLLVPVRPQGSSFSVRAHATIVAGDRPDTLANTWLGDPTAGWRLADANDTLSEQALIRPGREIAIPLPKVGSQ